MPADDTVTAKLAEWETLTEGATEGPWAVPHDHEEVYADTCVTIGDHGWVAVGPEGQSPAYDEDTDQGRADAEFIAHAREMVPALLGFVEDVRALADWHETKAHKARTFPGKGHEAEKEKVARVHEDAAQRIHALTERIGGEGR